MGVDRSLEVRTSLRCYVVTLRVTLRVTSPITFYYVELVGRSKDLGRSAASRRHPAGPDRSGGPGGPIAPGR